MDFYCVQFEEMDTLEDHLYRLPENYRLLFDYDYSSDLTCI